MHLIPYILLAYVAVGMQVGLNGYVKLGGAAPNVGLILAVFFALFVPREAAKLACFALGLMQDLLTQQTLGLYAISYGLIGAIIGNHQATVFRERPLTHAAVTAVACAITWSVLLVHGWVFGPASSVATAFYGTLLTVLLAPPLILLLMRLRPALGLRGSRRF
jgi:rod shape-determining protein MreD